MSAVRCYAMWRTKEGIKLKKKDITYFSPGGFSFTNKNGRIINFDFEESEGIYHEEDGILDFDLKEIDNDLVTSFLEENNDTDLIKEQYDIDFFKDGYIDLEKNEFHCCMDLFLNDEYLEEVNFKEYIEPVFLSVFDPYSDEKVILYNNLTEDEYKEYML